MNCLYFHTVISRLGAYLGYVIAHIYEPVLCEGMLPIVPRILNVEFVMYSEISGINKPIMYTFYSI